MHSDWPVPPCALPGEHSVQLVADAFGAILPELHGKQDVLPPSAMKYPEAQSMHSAWPAPPCALPGEHSVQLVVNPLLYFPAPQAMQLMAFVSLLVKDPSLHSKQSPLCAVGAYFPIRQSTHSV